MRKFLILSVLALVAVSATGCMNRNPCGDSWRPGYYLFGWGRHPQPHPADCCDPCGNGGPMMAPVMTSAPCCQ